MSDASTKLRVGYVLKQYPRLSETFILNEILGLEANNVDVSIFSLRHATEGRFHPGISAVRAPVRYMPSPDRSTFLSAIRAVPGLSADRLPQALAFVDRLPSDRRSRLLLDALNIADHARAEKFTHLHAHFMTIAAHTVHLVSLLTGIPFTVTAHAKDIYRSTVDWDLARELARQSAAIVTVCDANLAFLQDRLGASAPRLVRVYNGLGLQPRPTPVDERDAGLIVGIGRLVEKKGFDLLIDSVARLHAKDPTVRCVLVGDGDQRPMLEAQTARLGLDQVVTFAGALPQDQVSVWLQRAQVMAAPCRVGADGNQDALPTVLLEALGAGLPAVSTPVAGIPEIITDGDEGMIVPCDDVEALAAALSTVLADAALRERMATAAPLKLAAHFDRSKTIVQLIDTFRCRELVKQ